MGAVRELDPAKDGTLRWELRVYVGKDPVTGKPRQRSKVFRGGKRAANKALTAFEAKLLGGELGGSTGTVGQLLDAWLESGTPDITPVTRATYVRTTALLKPPLGGIKLAKLGPHDIEVAYQEMTKAGVSPFVLKQCHTSLRSALTTGLRWGWVPRNPAQMVKAPRVPKREVEAPTVEDVTALIRQIEPDDPDLAAAVTIAALTGLRRGELCGLKWSDVDHDTLHIRRAWVVADGKPVLALPKMGKVASVLISDPVWLALMRIASAQLERHQASGHALPDDGWILSMDGVGQDPRKPDFVGRAIAEAGRRIGLRITPHGLRHFAGSYLIAQGVDIRTAATQLRHDPRVLMDHYAAQDPKRRQEAADLLGLALTPSK